jgi:hypothetical protein
LIDGHPDTRAPITFSVGRGTLGEFEADLDAHGRYIPSFWRQKASVAAARPKLPGFKVRIAIELPMLLAFR